ncbi:MAG TPA: glycosyltransferase family 2 protein [Chloroflexota bacterium]|nr:glycosyltransferase family 2 protein [Chloroflexota bacterium]
MTGRTGVTLIIPAWNEAESIGAVLDEVPRSAVDHILVVVSGPMDPTAAVARARGARVLVQQQPGYGAACWTGAQTALAEGAQIVAFLDGDYADPPAELPNLLAPLLTNRADLVLGRRDLRRFPTALPPHARLGNRLVLLLLRVLLGTRFGDLPSFKAIRADALRQMRMREMTYGWTVEMLVKAARAGLRIEEAAIEYRPRMGGQSKVAGTLRGSLRAAATLLGCAVVYLTWRPSASRQWSAISGQ